MYHDVKNIFHVLIIFQCLFFAALLLLQTRGRRTGNLLLAAFLVFRAAAEVGGVLFHFQALRDAIYASVPQLFWIDMPFDFLYAPALYLYVLSLAEKDFALRARHLIHAVPSLLALAYILVRFEFRSAGVLRSIITPDSRFSPVEGHVLTGLIYLQFFGYAVAGLVTLRHYREEVKEVFSTIDEVNLSWLKAVLYGFMSWEALSVIEYGLWLVLGTKPVIYLLYIAAEVTFLLFLCLLFVRGLRQPEVFTGEIAAELRRKYEKTLLPEPARAAYRDKLVTVMDSQKPYLDPLLSLPDLARKVGLPAHQLSQVINTCFERNFFDFVNSYRIRESQRLLAGAESQGRTVLEILYETGFNSKSVFNTVFKRYTGMTPTEYKRQIHAS